MGGVVAAQLIGVMLLPLIAWSFEDRRTLRLRLTSLGMGFAFAVALALWTGTPLYIGAAIAAGCITRLGLATGDAVAMAYLGLVTGWESASIALVVVFMFLMLWAPRHPTPAIPLIASVSGVVACGDVLYRLWGGV